MIYSLKMLLHNMTFNAKSKRIYEKCQEKKHYRNIRERQHWMEMVRKAEISLDGRTYQAKEKCKQNLRQEIKTLYGSNE